MRFLFADFELDSDTVELRRKGVLIKAEPGVLRLLEVLVRSEGKLVTKEELLARVWDGRAVADNVITVAMTRLRKTLGNEAGEREIVLNVHGRGYRFVCPVVLEALEAPAAEPPPRPETAKPFVGRERVLEALAGALTDADAGRGQACVLTGDPGIGKTRALEVFEQQAVQRGALVAWGHCQQAEDTPPLWPFVQILRQLLARSSTREPRTEPAAWAARFPELAMLLPELSQSAAEPTSARPRRQPDGAGAKRRVFDAILRLLSSVSERQTCVLVLDDIQRADAASLELLQSLVDQLQRMRLLLRAAFPHSGHARASARAQVAYVHGHRNTTRLALEPLRQADVESYVSTLLEGSSRELAHAVFVKSEGNPFFMQELVRQLRDSDRRAGSEFALPEAALELVRRRLAILDEAARGALSFAAVIGRRFELSTLQAVTGQGAPALMISLDAALSSEVVVRAPDSATAFVFAHDLLRVALCDMLTPHHLRDCHLRVALELERRPRSGPQNPAADLAFHFHAALPESDLRKTVQYCAAAAGEAINLFAHADGRRHLRHARQALELMEQPSQRLRLDLLFREALLARESLDADFEPLLREVIRVASEQKSGQQLASAGLMLNVNVGLPALSGSREVLEEALPLLLADDPMRGAVLARLATSAPLAYDARKSAEQLARALELATRGEAIWASYIARSAQLYLFGGATDQSQADEATQALELLNQRHRGRISRPPLLIELHRAIRRLQAGDLAGVDAALARCEGSSAKLGEHELDWYVKRARAMQRIHAGDGATGVRELYALHHPVRHGTPPGSRLLEAYDQCVVSAEVSSLSSKALRAVLERDLADSPNICALKVHALACAGMHDEAHGQLRSIAPGAIADLPRDRDYLGTLAALAHAAVELRASAYVDALSAALTEHMDSFAGDGSFSCEPVPTLLGLLAQSQGRQDHATTLLARGAAMARHAGLALSSLSRPSQGPR